jgi:hypothetical protein
VAEPFDVAHDKLRGATPIPVKQLDRGRLLAHLATKARHRNILIHAVISGLITAINRGDFDTNEETS